MPLVSICIPAYNHTYYLQRTLQSIFSQSFTNFEVIITDDSPSAIVKELVDSFQPDSRIRYYKNEVTLGSPENWNQCIGRATGEYVKIMHHDDWFSTVDSLKLFVDAIEDFQTPFVFSNANVVFAKSEKTGFHSPCEGNLQKLAKNPKVLFLGNFIGAPSMTLYRKNTNLKFDNKLKWLVDVDFYISYLLKNPGFYHINENLMTIVTDADHTVTSISYNNSATEIFESFYLYHKLYPWLSVSEKFNFAVFLLHLIHRFKVSNIKEIRAAGYPGKIPFAFKLLLSLKKIKTGFKNLTSSS